MTRPTNARVAGATFLVYIAAGITNMTHAGGAAGDVVLSFVEVLSALVLAVTLYAITRDVDSDLALLGMSCRLAEGVVGAAGMATKAGTMLVGATLFAVGSTVFCWLLLRGRLIPRPLAWLGVLASILLVVWLPLELGGILPDTFLVWLPMLVFEVAFAHLLLARGV